MTDATRDDRSRTPHSALVDAVRERPEAPFLTYYDGQTSERIELSGTTFMNWVAKSANLLRDSIGLAESPTVALALPAHWQTVVIVHAVWALGGSVVTDPDEPTFGAAELLVRAADAPSTTDDDHDDVLVLALRALAAPGDVPPAHVWDYDREVRLGGDTFSASSVSEDATAWTHSGTTSSHGEVVRRVVGRLGSGDRRLVARERGDGPGVIDLGVVAALGTGVVLVVDADEAERRRIAEQERCRLDHESDD